MKVKLFIPPIRKIQEDEKVKDKRFSFYTILMMFYYGRSKFKEKDVSSNIKKQINYDDGTSNFDFVSPSLVGKERFYGYFYRRLSIRRTLLVIIVKREKTYVRYLPYIHLITSYYYYWSFYIYLKGLICSCYYRILQI